MERDSELTLETAKETQKATEQKLKIEQEDAAIEDAHRASTKGKGKGLLLKCDYCNKSGYTKIFCWDWLYNTDDGREWTEDHLDQKRTKPSKKGTKSDSSSNSNTKSSESASKSPSRSRGRSRRAAQLAEDEGWMAIDEDVGVEVKSLSFEAENPTGASRFGLEHLKADTTSWMLDSRASRHMTYQQSLFTKSTPCHTSVRIANGQRLWSEGIGEGSINIEGRVIRLSNVLLVARLDANLLSISALNRKGLSVLFNQDGVEILRSGISVALVLCKAVRIFCGACKLRRKRKTHYLFLLTMQFLEDCLLFLSPRTLQFPNLRDLLLFLPTICSRVDHLFLRVHQTRRALRSTSIGLLSTF